MLIIQLLKTEIGLKFECSSQKLFDFNRLKIVLSMGVSLVYTPLKSGIYLVLHNFQLSVETFFT
jgi:hypothetical protein